MRWDSSKWSYERSLRGIPERLPDFPSKDDALGVTRLVVQPKTGTASKYSAAVLEIGGGGEGDIGGAGDTGCSET